jgi:sporulation protein YlmC with PRC-barrel domain
MVSGNRAMMPMVDVIGASKVTGTEVYDQEGQRLGEIHDVLLNTAAEKIEFAILNFGSHFVGIDQRYYPLPWRLLKFDETRRGYVVNIDREKLGDAPTFELSDTGLWLDDGSGTRVNDYYGTASM